MTNFGITKEFIELMHLTFKLAIEENYLIKKREEETIIEKLKTISGEDFYWLILFHNLKVKHL